MQAKIEQCMQIHSCHQLVLKYNNDNMKSLKIINRNFLYHTNLQIYLMRKVVL